MKYDNPELREQLAAEYVLGTMPVLVRRRFERLLATDPELRQVVENWTARFEPIDYAAAAEEPPARIWRAVERRLALPSAPATTRPTWWGSLAFWRGATLAAAALAAAAIVYVAVRTPPAPTNVVAILSDDKGDPGWIALRGERNAEIEVAPIRKVAGDAAHAFELWAIAKGPPRPLGLLPPEPGHKLMVQASLVPPGSVLAVSIEPTGGSPTGLPTGPVRYKGNVLSGEP
jgi:anti-sigma-K factor RskA